MLKKPDLSCLPESKTAFLASNAFTEMVEQSDLAGATGFEAATCGVTGENSSPAPSMKLRFCFGIVLPPV